MSGSLFYRINGGDYAEINLTADDGVTNGYYADIPAQELNTVVDYYLSATDGENNVTYPFNTDNGGFSFFVSLFETFANMGGSSEDDGTISISWGTPVPISGSLSGLKLYRSTEPNVSIDPSNLIQEFGTNDNSFVDTDTYEGDICLLYTSPSPRDLSTSRMPSSA